LGVAVLPIDGLRDFASHVTDVAANDTIAQDLAMAVGLGGGP
jgi:hypothetical protein